VSVTAVGYDESQTDLTSVLVAAHATTADMVIPYSDSSGCVNLAKSLKELGITDAKKIVSAPLCLNGQVAAGLGLADQGQSMLLIEHDMGLVLGICDRVVVLEFGTVIAEGPPEVVRQDPRVIAAYLGDGVTSDSVTSDSGAAGGGMVATALADDQPE
jgi:Branched-chain amino acid ATP-binding cassette transporter